MQDNTQKLTGKPRWWTASHNSAWENVRDAVKREWEAAERHSEVDQEVDTASERTLGDARFDSGEPRNVEVDRAARSPTTTSSPRASSTSSPRCVTARELGSSTPSTPCGPRISRRASAAIGEKPTTRAPGAGSRLTSAAAGNLRDAPWPSCSSESLVP